ncbi:MAG: radical SAM protein [Bdellovibrio sp.]|nr:radical SAM protein [Bdellovibrio sp.]
MISTKHLLALAKVLQLLDVKWWVQLRPTKDLIPALPTLAQAGLHTVCWGVESGNQRILDLMKKGTNIQDIQNVLATSHNSGIKNMVYIMFGFPTETKEEVMHSFDFLTEQNKNIDLICSSIFGLQHGSAIYEHPEKYHITQINEKQRIVLDPKVTYTTASGLTTEQAKKIRHRHMHRLNAINKVPKVFDYVKEQMLLF